MLYIECCISNVSIMLYIDYMYPQVFFLAVTLGTALAVHDLSIMLSIVGATGSTTVSYILPGFYYYVLFRKAEDGPAWKRYLALIQGIAGLIIVPLCLTFIFL